MTYLEAALKYQEALKAERFAAKSLKQAMSTHEVMQRRWEEARNVRIDAAQQLDNSVIEGD